MRHDPIDPARSGGPESPAVGLADPAVQVIMHELDALEGRALATIAASEDEIRALEGGATDDAHPDTARILAMAALADVAARERNAVEAIAAARARLLEGTFGACAACGRLIAPSRLHALPIATVCVGCEARVDGPHPKAAA